MLTKPIVLTFPLSLTAPKRPFSNPSYLQGTISIIAGRISKQKLDSNYYAILAGLVSDSTALETMASSSFAFILAWLSEPNNIQRSVRVCLPILQIYGTYNSAILMARSSLDEYGDDKWWRDDKYRPKLIIHKPNDNLFDFGLAA